MRVLIDTSVWSLALRRRRKDLSPDERAIVLALGEVIGQGQAVLVGVVRQELLSGTPDAHAFGRLREHLWDFPDEPPTLDDYEDAAHCDNVCCRAGVAASPVDMLPCPISRRLDAPVMTTDRDFDRYADQLSVRLVDVPR